MTRLLFEKHLVPMTKAKTALSSPHTNSVWVPHVRTSPRGLIKTGRSPIKALTTFPQSRSWVGARFWRDVGFHRSLPENLPRIKAEDGEPDLCVSGMECFFSESRMQSITPRVSTVEGSAMRPAALSNPSPETQRSGSPSSAFMRRVG